MKIIIITFILSGILFISGISLYVICKDSGQYDLMTNTTNTTNMDCNGNEKIKDIGLFLIVSFGTVFGTCGCSFLFVLLFDCYTNHKIDRNNRNIDRNNRIEYNI